jgi:hypothetical protein
MLRGRRRAGGVDLNTEIRTRGQDEVAEAFAIGGLEAAFAACDGAIGGEFRAGDLGGDAPQDIAAKRGHGEFDGFSGFQEERD